MNTLKLAVIKNETKQTSNGPRAVMTLGLENTYSVTDDQKFLDKEELIYRKVVKNGKNVIKALGPAKNFRKSSMTFFTYFAHVDYASIRPGATVHMEVSSIHASPYQKEDGEWDASMTIQGSLSLSPEAMRDFLGGAIKSQARTSSRHEEVLEDFVEEESANVAPGGEPPF